MDANAKCIFAARWLLAGVFRHSDGVSGSARHVNSYNNIVNCSVSLCDGGAATKTAKE